MPSIIIPTSQEQLTMAGSGAVAGDTFNNTTRQGTIQLHGRYVAQFGGSSASSTSNSGKTTMLPVLPAAELDYYITWYDTNVFESVSVANDGLLTYKVKNGVDITIGSFMNIVFAVREN